MEGGQREKENMIFPALNVGGTVTVWPESNDPGDKPSEKTSLMTAVFHLRHLGKITCVHKNKPMITELSGVPSPALATEMLRNKCVPNYSHLRTASSSCHSFLTNTPSAIKQPQNVPEKNKGRIKSKNQFVRKEATENAAIIPSYISVPEIIV